MKRFFRYSALLILFLFASQLCGCGSDIESAISKYKDGDENSGESTGTPSNDDSSYDSFYATEVVGKKFYWAVPKSEDGVLPAEYGTVEFTASAESSTTGTVIYTILSPTVQTTTGTYSIPDTGSIALWDDTDFRKSIKFRGVTSEYVRTYTEERWYLDGASALSAAQQYSAMRTVTASPVLFPGEVAATEADRFTEQNLPGTKFYWAESGFREADGDSGIIEFGSEKLSDNRYDVTRTKNGSPSSSYASFMNGSVRIGYEFFTPIATNAAAKYIVVQRSNQVHAVVGVERWYYGANALADAVEYLKTRPKFSAEMISGKTFYLDVFPATVTFYSDGTFSAKLIEGTLTGPWTIDSDGVLKVGNDDDPSFFYLRRIFGADYIVDIIDRDGRVEDREAKMQRK